MDIATVAETRTSSDGFNSFKSVIQLALRFTAKAAQRIVALTADDWRQVENLAVLLKDATDTEKTEIIEAICEVVFPEETIGGVIDPIKTASADARSRTSAYRANVGEQIKIYRQQQKMTQQQLARKAGIPQSHVSRLESGRHTPAEATIRKIAKALKTKPSQLDPGFLDDDE